MKASSGLDVFKSTRKNGSGATFRIFIVCEDEHPQGAAQTPKAGEIVTNSDLEGSLPHLLKLLPRDRNDGNTEGAIEAATIVRAGYRFAGTMAVGRVRKDIGEYGCN